MKDNKNGGDGRHSPANTRAMHSRIIGGLQRPADHLSDDSNPIASVSPYSTGRSMPGKDTTLTFNNREEIEIGTKVVAKLSLGWSRRGIVRYIGTLPMRGEQIYVGVELLRPGTF